MKTYKLSELMRKGLDIYKLPACQGHTIKWNSNNTPHSACAYGDALLGVVEVDGLDLISMTNDDADMRLQRLIGYSVHTKRVPAPFAVAPIHYGQTSVFAAMTYLNDTLQTPIEKIANWLEEQGL